MSGQTPVPGLAERPSSQRAYMVHVLIRHPSLPSGETTAEKCPRLRNQSEPAAAQTPTVSGVDAPGVLSAWPPNLRALPLATVPCSPPPASSQPVMTPTPRRGLRQQSKVAVPMLARSRTSAARPTLCSTWHPNRPSYVRQNLFHLVRSSGRYVGNRRKPGRTDRQSLRYYKTGGDAAFEAPGRSRGR